MASVSIGFLPCRCHSNPIHILPTLLYILNTVGLIDTPVKQGRVFSVTDFFYNNIVMNLFTIGGYRGWVGVVMSFML